MYICIYSPRGILWYRNRDRCMKKSNMGDDIGCWIQSVLYKKMQGGFLQITSWNVLMLTLSVKTSRDHPPRITIAFTVQFFFVVLPD
jgi:hypothetical protein